MNKKGLDYALSMVVVVIVALPILYYIMATEIDDQKEKIGEEQTIILGAPYAKEDTINYAEKSAELAMPEILAELQNTIPTIGCDQSLYNTIKNTFNKHLNVYIKEYNKKSFTKMPEDNYEIYIEGNNIHAIAIEPVKKLITKPKTELMSVGTMWFKPSFTITTNLDKIKPIIEAKKQSCPTI